MTHVHRNVCVCVVCCTKVANEENVIQGNDGRSTYFYCWKHGGPTHTYVMMSEAQRDLFFFSHRLPGNVRFFFLFVCNSMRKSICKCDDGRWAAVRFPIVSSNDLRHDKMLLFEKNISSMYPACGEWKKPEGPLGCESNRNRFWSRKFFDSLRSSSLIPCSIEWFCPTTLRQFAFAPLRILHTSATHDRIL